MKVGELGNKKSTRSIEVQKNSPSFLTIEKESMRRREEITYKGSV
jgi:hypothetical protein